MIRIKQKSGFTVFEVLVVLGVVVLVSTISIPLLINYQKITKLKSEARILATNLRLTQQFAITEQKIYNLKFWPALDKYQIINSETSEIVKEISLNPEISISQVNDLTDDTVQFISTGGVIESGQIILTNSKNETSTLEIKPSGYIQIIE